MEYQYSKNKIVLDRSLSSLDQFVIDFVKVLDRCGINYVIVSGYISIVFGRSRYTEDVDMLVEELSYEKFENFWDEAIKEFECMNTDDPKDAYHNYLKEKTSIRFFKNKQPFPNMEFKICSSSTDFESLKNSIDLILSHNRIKTSPIEMQIAFKLHLGSEKD